MSFVLHPASDELASEELGVEVARRLARTVRRGGTDCCMCSHPPRCCRRAGARLVQSRPVGACRACAVWAMCCERSHRHALMMRALNASGNSPAHKTLRNSTRCTRFREESDWREVYVGIFRWKSWPRFGEKNRQKVMSRGRVYACTLIGRTDRLRHMGLLARIDCTNGP